MNDLTIHYAQYGTEIVKKDVLDIIKKKISKNERLYFIINNENLGGDFLPGKHKILHIIYTFNGVFYDEIINELELLIIPKPQIVKIVTKTTNYKTFIFISLAISLIVSLFGFLLMRFIKYDYLR